MNYAITTTKSTPPPAAICQRAQSNYIGQLMSYNPYKSYPGGFSANDGTIDFYSRINALIQPEMTVIDLGAGRAAWYEDDTNQYRRSLRTLQGKVQRLIAVDIDEAVLSHNCSDEQYVIGDGTIPLHDNAANMVVADYVLEHVDDIAQFSSEVDRVLTPGGWFCARTPHKYSYVSVAAQILGNLSRGRLLSSAQPDRKEHDKFPTIYKLNTTTAIKNQFPKYRNFSFCFQTDPAYYFGNKWVFYFENYLHKIMPNAFSGNLFVFLRKDET